MVFLASAKLLVSKIRNNVSNFFSKTNKIVGEKGFVSDLLKPVLLFFAVLVATVLRCTNIRDIWKSFGMVHQLKTNKIFAVILGMTSSLLAVPSSAQILNGDFETRTPPGSSFPGAFVGDPDGTFDNATCFVDTTVDDSGTAGGGTGTGFYAGGEARYAPTPWDIQSTPDYQTTTTIYFDTLRYDRLDLGTAAVPGTELFDLSTNGGCFQGFRSLSVTSPEGISQTMTIAAADVNTPLVYKYEYAEYTAPGAARCTPNVEFRVDTSTPFSGTAVGVAPTIGQPNGPTREGEWVALETSSFLPSDFGVPAGGGTLDIYLGVTANGCANTWGFVDGLEITIPSPVTSSDLSMTKTLDTAGPYTPGQPVTYTLVASNAGPDIATNVVVTDLPTNLTVTSATGTDATCVISPASGVTTSVVCSIATLGVGVPANKTITIMATVP